MDNKSFKELVVWQKGVKLVEDVYCITKKLPESEKFGISSQMNRAAVSIPSNIAEGQKREGKQEFKRFVSIARGSAAELETQLIVVKRLFNIDVNGVLVDLDQVQRMLTKLHQSLR